jgi:hypothetical protein
MILNTVTCRVTDNTTPAMPSRAGAQSAQGSRESHRLFHHGPHLRCALPWQPRGQRSARDPLHLGSTQLPPRSMPAQHRPGLVVRHGGLRRGRAAG